MQLEVFDNAQLLCKEALSIILAAVEDKKTKTVTHGHRLALALSGGSTPKTLYSMLKMEHPAVASQSIQYYFGDVRMVSDDSPDSNYAMAHDALLHLVPADHVVIINTTVDPEAAADAYAKTLRERLPLVDDGVDEHTCPVLDLVLLGAGPDGHTASLFPGTPAAAENKKMVVTCMPNEGVKPYVQRITLTRRVIQAANQVVLMATGKDKTWVLESLLASDDDIVNGKVKDTVVRSVLRGCRGRVTVLVDANMAADLRTTNTKV